MYTINPLMRNVLITFEEVMFHAPTKHDVDRRIIDNSIIVAEERFIRSELGSDLYDYMAAQKNTLVTPGNIAALTILVNQNVDPERALVLNSGDLVNALEYLAPSYQALWKQYVWKIVAECVMTTALPEGFVQFSSEGAFHSVPPAGLMVTSGLVTPLLGSMKWQLDKKIQDRIDPLLNGMHNYLCKNKTSFIYYKGDCPDCGELPKKKWTGFCTGLYDNDEESDCCS